MLPNFPKFCIFSKNVQIFQHFSDCEQFLKSLKLSESFKIFNQHFEYDVFQYIYIGDSVHRNKYTDFPSQGEKWVSAPGARKSQFSTGFLCGKKSLCHTLITDYTHPNPNAKLLLIVSKRSKPALHTNSTFFQASENVQKTTENV